MHLFGQEAGRDVKLRKLFQFAGCDADLFFKLASCTRFRIFAFIERSRAYLEQIFPGSVTVLADKGDRTVFKDRDDHYAAFMNDDLTLVLDFALVDLVDADVEYFAFVDGFG